MYTEEHIDTTEVCPVCKGTGKITPSVLFTDEIENKVNYIIKELNKSKLTIRVHPYVAAYLTKGFWSLRKKWAMKFFKRIKVESDSSYNFMEYHFYDENLEEIIL